jgi:hypothetical protein
MSKPKTSSKRTALSPRNILAYEAEECARIKHRNRCMRSNVLKTRPEYLNTFVVVNPALKECTSND